MGTRSDKTTRIVSANQEFGRIYLVVLFMLMSLPREVTHIQTSDTDENEHGSYEML